MTIEEIEELLIHAKESMNESKFSEAEQLSRQCIENLTLHNDNIQSLVMAYRILCESYIKRGIYQQAYLIAKQVLDLYEQYLSHENQAHILRLIGIIKLENSEFEIALQYLEESLSIFKYLDQDYNAALCLHDMARIYYSYSNYSVALEYFEKVLLEFEKNNDKIRIGKIKNNIAMIYHVQAEYHQAISLYLEAILIYNEYNVKSDLATSLSNLGVAYKGISDYENSFLSFQKAITIFEELNMSHHLAQCIGNIGVNYRELHDYERSIEYLKKSVTMHQELGLINGMAMFIGNLGITYSQMGNHVQSLEYLKEAYQLYKYLHQEVESALFACNIGHGYYLFGKYEQALQYSHESLPILQKNGRHEEATGAYRTIGLVYASPNYMGYNCEKAEKILLEVIDSYTHLDTKLYLCETHEFLATLYKQEHRWEEYAEHIEKYHQLSIEVQNEEVKKQVDRFGWERKLIEMEKEKEMEKIKNEADKKILEETINFQKLSIEQQSRELKNTIEELVRKNSLLQHIQSDLQKIAPYTLREGTDLIKQLADRVERNITPLESNQQLHNQLNEIHKDFMYNLHEKFPDLTTMELKIAALLSMKLTSSNIAAALFLSKRTVESHRLSLRKKCSIGKDDNIYEELSKYMV
jgi:tetratricopeptide (TPR) repeat protein/DNA-binding CsgD family transcriptional regulator